MPIRPSLILLLTGLMTLPAAAEPTLLLSQPTLSAEHLAFVHGGDLWVSDRQGGAPRRLTSHAASEFAPKFSPDGKQIAFSASYEGNTDVYVMPVAGGQPRRLSWHPAADVVSGWSADGQRVLFASPREVANGRSNQLFEVPADGGFERKLMEAQAYEGSWSADGKRLAFRPWRAGHVGTSGWRLHRGGSSPPIWILEPATQRWSSVPRLPEGRHSDIAPVWVGDELVYISDRDGRAANLWAFDTRTQALRQLTQETVWDVRSVASHQGQLVYEVGGRLKTMRIDGSGAAELSIQLQADSAQLRPQFRDLTRALDGASLSPTGKRVLLSARGEVLTVPVKDGTPRNLSNSSGVREKNAVWSPDGLQVAYVSDAPGRRHQLVLREASGQGKPRVLALPADDYFSLLAWSPDGQRLLLQDQRLKLYVLPVSGGSLQRIATQPRRAQFSPSFSPDGRYLAYTLRAANHLSQIHLHDFQSGRSQPLVDADGGLVHADHPVFSRKGDLLFFTASTNAGPSRVGLDMSTQERPLRAGVYAAVLRRDGVSPLLPRSGDEEVSKPTAKASEPAAGAGSKPTDKPAADKPTDKPLTRIDFDGLAQRLVPLPLPERNHAALAVAHDGSLWFLDRRQPGSQRDAPEAELPPAADLYRFDFESRQAKLLRSGVADFGFSGDGKKLLLELGRGKFEVGDASEKLEAKPLVTAGLRARIDPREEWRQIFDETWWMQKAFFYDPALHGIDWDAVHARLRPLVEHVARREDLNELLVTLIAELQVGHNRVGGGDVHQEPVTPVGLLGADFSFEQGRWRIQRIHGGDAWNPFLRAPLTVPGAQAREGEFLLAVNGQALEGSRNLHELLAHTVGQQVTLSLAADAQGTQGLRQIVVQPASAANEALLRQWSWVEANRRRVQQASGGRVAYVYLPDTGGGGFQFFNRMFFAQADKEALIVDERRNGGGQAANYITELLARPHLGGWKDRDGLIYNTPGSAIHGPKAMLIDQDAGSGGDFLPYAFKRLGLGPLIGQRTWGGLIGISANPPLIDGGQLVVPFFRFFTPEGEWRIENEGVAPDIEVVQDPVAVNAGRDPQLEAAIADVLKRLPDWKPITTQQAPAPARLGR
jgi:tricorn protease